MSGCQVTEHLHGGQWGRESTVEALKTQMLRSAAGTPPRPMQMFWACQEVRGEGGSQES